MRNRPKKGHGILLSLIIGTVVVGLIQFAMLFLIENHKSGIHGSST